jgi:hypothetical protein
VKLKFEAARSRSEVGDGCGASVLLNDGSCRLADSTTSCRWFQVLALSEWQDLSSIQFEGLSSFAGDLIEMTE